MSDKFGFELRRPRPTKILCESETLRRLSAELKLSSSVSQQYEIQRKIDKELKAIGLRDLLYGKD